MPGFKVHNRSNEMIFCAITNKTNPGGNAGWFEIAPATNLEWSRSGWEDVSFKDKHNTRSKALWINRGGPALIYFDGFEKELTIYNDYRPDPGFTVNNFSPRTIMCFISASSRGDSSWFKIPPGESETWRRTGWEAIGVRSENGSQRKGAFFDNNGAKATVDFHDFDEEFVFHEAPKNFIAAEHYAEAVHIADRSYAASSSRASAPGGLTASVYKIDQLELIVTGKKSSLEDHIQIYTLALLINHLKYGLAEPAVVVSVTPA
ncbi:hypothetical protein C8R44DRAFT_78390 [Mycena epipterygia]|nr:hypothetical protein C8R44DRAFT_78390 [Mycena epipterygia]